jgi:hypothetical protein
MFVAPGDEVYEGMIVGENSPRQRHDVNPTKEKKLTNMRAAAATRTSCSSRPRKMSLEAALEYIEDDELVEVTPTQDPPAQEKIAAKAAPRRSACGRCSSKKPTDLFDRPQRIVARCREVRKPQPPCGNREPDAGAVSVRAVRRPRRCRVRANPPRIGNGGNRDWPIRPSDCVHLRASRIYAGHEQHRRILADQGIDRRRLVKPRDLALIVVLARENRHALDNSEDR